MIRWLVPALLLPVVAAGSALERGLQAKMAGDFPTATRELATAVEQSPGNAEAWLHYGTVLGWQKRYPEARAALERGLAIAPRDFDLRLAHARVLAWQADYPQASAELAALAREHPDNLDVRVMQGRVAGWSGRPDEAAAHYQAVLARDPKQLDALTGLGDLARDRQAIGEARGYYEQAMAQIDAPADIQSRLDNLDSARLWRWDAGTTWSHFDGGDRSDWWGVWTQLARQNALGTWWGRIEQEERFDQADTTLLAGWSRHWENATVSLFGGGSPDADWAARWTAEGDFAWHPTKDPWPWLVAEIRHSEYVPRGVWTFRTGLDQPLGKGWRATLRWTHLEFQGGEPTDGWIAAIEREMANGWWWRVGTASGAESLTGEALQSNSVLRSQTWFAGVRGPITDTWGWRADVEREVVDGGPDRTAVSLGVHHSF
jgi:YaiO family outer membrane protein